MRDVTFRPFSLPACLVCTLAHRLFGSVIAPSPTRIIPVRAERICADMGGWSEGLGCVSCLVRLVASRLLSHGDDSLPLGVSVSEVAHSVRDLVECVGPAYDGGDIRGFDQLFEHQQVRFVRR